MRCPHCRAEVPRHRRGPDGGQCTECRRLFVTDRRVAYTAFSVEFLRTRVAALSGDGALRVTSLQLQRDVWRRRPYPPEPPPPLSPGMLDFDDPPALAVVVAIGAIVGGGGFAIVAWRDAVSVELLVVATIMTLLMGVMLLAFLLQMIFYAVPVFVLRLLGRLVTALIPDRRKVVLTRSAFTALARSAVTELVEENGTAPPPAPDPVRFAVLCPDPAVAACLWANDVGGRLGALVVTAREDLPRRTPVLDLSAATAGDSPADLLSEVLPFGCRHVDAGRTGFLSWPGDG
jgi:hypothetical protein